MVGEGGEWGLLWPPGSHNRVRLCGLRGRATCGHVL